VERLPEPSMTSLDPNSSTVMVVDDHGDIRETLAMILEDAGFDVVTAADGRDALRQLHDGPRPQLILLDLMMPNMDGWEFRRRQEADTDLSAIPVVLLSGVNDVHRQVLPLHADGYLRKPFDIDTMLEVVRSYCRA
jgi:CheY-like chemotaxis protein